MLNKDCRERLTVNQCLKHNWFIDPKIKNNIMDSNILSNINKIFSKNKIQQAVYDFIIQ